MSPLSAGIAPPIRRSEVGWGSASARSNDQCINCTALDCGACRSEVNHSIVGRAEGAGKGTLSIFRNFGGMFFTWRYLRFQCCQCAAYSTSHLHASARFGN